jgi:hypothetical protein
MYMTKPILVPNVGYYYYAAKVFTSNLTHADAQYNTLTLSRCSTATAAVPYVRQCCQLFAELFGQYRKKNSAAEARLRIRIVCFLIADPDYGSGSRFDHLKLNKIYSWKFYFYFLDKKMQSTYP